MSSSTLTSEKYIVKPEILKSEIILTGQELEQEKEKHLKQIQKTVSMPGFRPGKTPITIIKKKYSNAAFYDGFEHLLKDKTHDVLNTQPSKVLYYVYNFDNTGIIQDDGTDKKIEIEYLLEPAVNINIKDKEVELVKFGFTEGQRKMYSDILILFNFLKENPVDKLENFNELFIVSLELKNNELFKSEEEDKRKKSILPMVIHTYQYQSYGLNELLPPVIEKDKTYSIDPSKWLDILNANFEKTTSLKEFLKTAADSNSQVEVFIRDIQSYPDINSFINTDRVKSVFNLDENTEVNADLIYSKLSDTIEMVAEYFSGNENIKRGNAFIQNIIQVEIPDDFIQKLYANYVKDEDKKYFSAELFKYEIISHIENNILKNLLPNTFNPSANYDEFATNVAKGYLVETLLSQMYLFDLNSTKSYIIHTLQSTDSANREQLLQNYHNKDSVFTFAKNLSQDVKVNTKLENINSIHFSDYIGVKQEMFV